MENQHVEDSHPACLISLTLIGCGPDYAASPTANARVVVDAGTSEFYDTGVNAAPTRDDEPQDDDHNAPHRDDEREPNTDERDPDRTEQPPANPAPENDCKGLEDAIYVIDKETESIHYYDTQKPCSSTWETSTAGSSPGAPPRCPCARRVRLRTLLRRHPLR